MKTVKLEGMYFSKSHFKSDDYWWHENVSNSVKLMFKPSACFWAEAKCMFLSTAGHVSAIPHGLRKGQGAGWRDGGSESQDCSGNSLDNVKDSFSTLGQPSLQKHILVLGCPRSDYLPICSREEFSRPAPLHSAYLSHRPLTGQLRGCEASSNYASLSQGCFLQLQGQTSSLPHSRIQITHAGHLSTRVQTPKHPVGAQLRHA